jgi:citrate lyase subunit beta / citryl-CoA lyase
MWPLRSLLFVPAHRRDWVGKAIRSGADAAVLDLEDSVPFDLKDKARSLLAEEIAELAAAGLGAVVRMNPLSDASADEIAAAVHPGLSAIMLPKASTPDQVRRLHDLLSYNEGRQGMALGTVGILPLPETAEGLQRCEALVAASSRCRGLVGTISGPVGADVAYAFGFRPSMGGLEQLYMNSKMVLDSRAGGAPYPVAGVFGIPMDDLEAVTNLVKRAKQLGYSGCSIMHPSHVEIVHKVFAPTAEEAEYFRGMLVAFAEAERNGMAAVRYQGAMVDYAMLPLAREIVAEFERRERAQSK